MTYDGCMLKKFWSGFCGIGFLVEEALSKIARWTTYTVVQR